MTDADMAKMDTINALDSAAPPPVEKRVRKSRAKPPAKNITPNKQNTQNKTMEEKEKTETPTRKRRHSVHAFHLRRCLFGRTLLVEDRAATPILTLIEEQTDETPSEPKKKKKKKKMSEDNTGVEGKEGKEKKKTGVSKGTQKKKSSKSHEDV
ncbi:hypothetical protein OYC64_015253 [Pagothenia borchgrevinki]|uniref:Uncharacterized protein n=1 Tax=Pagothenia borchgrevinki TaxID=8213 RepID=A0ABD2HEQ4_PAGBO